MYQSLHKKVPTHQKGDHQRETSLDLQLKKSAMTGFVVAGTGLMAASTLGVTAGVTANAAPITQSGSIPAQVKAVQQQKPAAKTQQDIEQEALIVIHGDLGNGDIRVQKLQQAGFDPVAVQKQVNQDWQTMGLGAEQAAAQAVQAAAQGGQVSQAAPSNSGTVQSFNNTVNTGSDVVNYASQQMANATGVSAAQWAAVIMRESGGNPNAVNAQSGAYGLFQLLGHGEYSGMSVDAQISMAENVYRSSGAGAWSETW